MLKNFKETPAMSAIVHLALSLLASALYAGLVAAIQYVSFNHFDIHLAITNFVGAFVGAVLIGLRQLRSNPQFVPAIFDALAQMNQALNSLASQPAAQAPVINVHPATVTVAQPTAASSGTVVNPVEPSATVGASNQDTTPYAALSSLNLPATTGR